MAGAIGHLLWMMFGAVLLKGAQWVIGFLGRCFGFGYKEAMVATMAKGRPLTPDELAALKVEIKEKLTKKLEKELEQNEEEKIL
jgi:hypothetical protein